MTGRRLGLRAGLLTALSLVILVSDVRWGWSGSVHAVLSSVLAPVRYLVDFPSRLLIKFDGEWRTRRSLIAENAKLKARVHILTSQLAQMQRSIDENDQLRALLSSSARAQGEFISAQIMAVSAGRSQYAVVIDRGLSSGVYAGQPVMDAHGLLGQVIDVGPLTSRVDMVNDPSVTVPVTVQRTHYRTLVSGLGDGHQLQLLYVPDTTDIRVGDRLLSSGLGLQYPKNVSVGEVVSVTTNPGERFAKIIVSPTARLYRSRLVLLVWPEKNQLKQAATKRLTKNQASGAA